MAQLLTQKFPPQETDKSLKHAFVRKSITTAQLKQLAEDCHSLVSLECVLKPSEQAVDETIYTLASRHPKLKRVSICGEERQSPITFRQPALAALMRLKHLQVLHLENVDLTALPPSLGMEIYEL